MSRQKKSQHTETAADLPEASRLTASSPTVMICCTCSLSKNISQFYSKGSRRDSTCKECQKEKKRAKYVAVKNQDVVAGLTNILTLTSQGLIINIQAETKRLDEVIACLKKSKQ